MRFCSLGQLDIMMMLFNYGIIKGKDQAKIWPHDGPLTRLKWDRAGNVDSCNEYWGNSEIQPSSWPGGRANVILTVTSVHSM